MFGDIRASCMGVLFSSPGIVTLTGGGGKTSLMYKLVSLLKADGINAVAATTTKIFINDRHQKQIMFVQSTAQCLDAVETASACSIPTVLCSQADTVAPNKAVGIPAEWLDEVSQKASDSIFVVEGDGSAGKSLKGHLSHEPVIPGSSKLVIPVIGMDVLGQPINERTVHRPERFCDLTGAKLGDVIDERLIAAILCHPEGYLQHIPAEAYVLPLLNKIETFVRRRSAINICKRIRRYKDAPIRAVLAGSIKQNSMSVKILENL